MALKKYTLILIPLFFPLLAYSNTPLDKKENKIPEKIVPGYSLGLDSHAEGNKSTAIGINSHAKASQSTAIGYQSLATEEKTISFGNKEKKTTSRLVNISEGKENNDAVNVIQMKTLVDKNKRISDNSINQLKRSVTSQISQIKTNLTDFDKYYKERQAIITDAIEVVDKKIISLEKKVFAGIASSVAIASIPYLAHNEFSSGIGISNYRTGTAIAGGIQYKPTNDIAVRINSSVNSESEIIIGGGLAYGW